MKPGNDFGRAGLRLFAKCELVCESLLRLQATHLPGPWLGVLHHGSQGILVRLLNSS